MNQVIIEIENSTSSKAKEARLYGELTRDTALAFWQKREQWLQQFQMIDGKSVNLSLKSMTKVDSAGLAVLILLLKHSRLAGCHVLLCAIPNQLLGLIQLSYAHTALAEYLEISAEG
ncbi:STAS domain-containing protein [Vibrio sp. SS-MA-C1-2]|uniref:STAS domain-containing protein n=1 Tax=Vibrio sp. SS-MA-C1-2 TaxID=2908646 RepID=UPI001F220535|nr:STAS domain-containing protein [Vibrio sp. SS-MA-C1-2]UJF19593.1 STAS domain-containing protein [Vibrio sp. SS-MA-C1-2]